MAENDDFPGFSKESAMFWLKVQDVFDKLHRESVLLNYYIGFVGIFLNIFHLFILTKKQMRTSSTDIIMIAISICDLVAMMELVKEFLIIQWMTRWVASKDKCWTPLSYYTILFSSSIFFTSDVLRHCAVWFAVLLSAIRTIAIRNPTRSKKICTTSFGWKSTLLTFLLSSIIPIAERLCTRIIVVGIWRPAEYCTGFPAKYTQSEYVETIVDIYNGTFNFWYIQSYVNMLAPSIILPVFTVLLLLELKKTEVRRQRMRSAICEHSNTSKFVLAMTISFVVAVAPRGIVFILMNVLKDYQGFLNILAEINGISFLTLSINSVIHVFISIFMSSQYRDTFRKTFGCTKKVQVIHPDD